MAACDKTLPVVATKTIDLKVAEEFAVLSKAALGDDSLYQKSKDTIFELFKQLDMSEPKKMELVAGQITSMTVGMSANLLNTAFAVVKANEELGYTLALTEQQSIKTKAEASAELAKICLIDAQREFQCASIEATIATSIRENGRVLTYDANNTCKPETLMGEGLKFEQTKQVQAVTYQTQADAYRKSGVVVVGTDGADNILKGLTGDQGGHTTAQTRIADRQYISFEDSKRNHAVNASSQTIGQILSADAILNPEIVAKYNAGLDYLLSDSPSSIAGGSATIDGVTIEFPGTITDTLVAEDMTVQLSPNMISMQILIPANSNIRNGDRIVVRDNLTSKSVYFTLSTADIAAGYRIVTWGSPLLVVGGADIATYAFQAYVLDLAGNQSVTDSRTITLHYTA